MANPTLTKTSERLTQPQFFGDPLRALLGGTFVKADGTQPLTAAWTVGGQDILGVDGLTASTINSVDVTGTNIGAVTLYTGDFSNVDLTLRTKFASAAGDSPTGIPILPTGAGDLAVLMLGNSSDIANTALLNVASSAASVYLNSLKTGTGTTLPMQFMINSTPVMTIATSGDITCTGKITGTEFVGTVTPAVFTGSTPGSVPTSLGGAVNFLRADGTWAAPSGLASASATAPLNLSIAGGALTGSVDVFGGTTPGVVPDSLGGTADYLRADGTWAIPSGSIGGLTLDRVVFAASATTLEDHPEFYRVGNNFYTGGNITAVGTVGGYDLLTSGNPASAGSDQVGYTHHNAGVAAGVVIGGNSTGDGYLLIGTGAASPQVQLGCRTGATTPMADVNLYTAGTGVRCRAFGTSGTAISGQFTATGAGGTSNVGLEATVSGATTNNYAVHLAASGATNNRAIYIDVSKPPAAANNHAIYSASQAQSYFEGNVGIGIAVAKSKLHVVGLPVYANNAAAIAGGLTAGAFYRTGADPDPVCVVH